MNETERVELLRAERQPLNVLEPSKLAALEEAVAELRRIATDNDYGFFGLIGGPWSKLAVVLEACQRSVPEAVSA